MFDQLHRLSKVAPNSLGSGKHCLRQQLVKDASSTYRRRWSSRARAKRSISGRHQTRAAPPRRTLHALQAPRPPPHSPAPPLLDRPRWSRLRRPQTPKILPPKSLPKPGLGRAGDRGAPSSPSSLLEPAPSRTVEFIKIWRHLPTSRWPHSADRTQATIDTRPLGLTAARGRTWRPLRGNSSPKAPSNRPRHLSWAPEEAKLFCPSSGSPSEVECRPRS
mmetsp:Transcript_52080/g.113351  ORF Transcript_52080/g.113351 Transcript_52080/m.113351 type:complete len:219 (+) Transcript_52080:387-1043(+)